MQEAGALHAGRSAGYPRRVPASVPAVYVLLFNGKGPPIGGSFTFRSDVLYWENY